MCIHGLHAIGLWKMTLLSLVLTWISNLVKRIDVYSKKNLCIMICTFLVCMQLVCTK